jgi:hypothetical protein
MTKVSRCQNCSDAFFLEKKNDSFVCSALPTCVLGKRLNPKRDRSGYECVDCDKDCTACKLDNIDDVKSYRCMSCKHEKASLTNGKCLIESTEKCGKGLFA